VLKIIDVGCKFGVHPSFLDILNISKIIMIDADNAEINYLREHYQGLSNLDLHAYFVAEDDPSKQFETLNKYKHPGGHSKFLPDMTDPYWLSFRGGTGEILAQEKVPCTSLNKLISESFSTDFLATASATPAF
jgi:hypothetical protein